MPDLEQVKHAVTELPVDETILRRWSPRAFSDKPVSDADLKTVFTAGTWAASSSNEQPWRFVVGRKGDATYEKIFNSLLPGNQTWAGAAPVLFAAFAKKTFTRGGKPNKVAMHDVGAACANIALEATSLGMHVHGMAGFDPVTLCAYFGVPEDFEPTACWALGFLGDPNNLGDQHKALEQAPRERRPISDVVFSEHWEQAARL